VGDWVSSVALASDSQILSGSGDKTIKLRGFKEGNPSAPPAQELRRSPSALGWFDCCSAAVIVETAKPESEQWQIAPYSQGILCQFVPLSFSPR